MQSTNKKSYIVFTSIFAIGAIIGWVAKPVSNTDHVSSDSSPSYKQYSNVNKASIDSHEVSSNIEELMLAIEQQSRHITGQQKQINSLLSGDAHRQLISDVIEETLSYQSNMGQFNGTKNMDRLNPIDAFSELPVQEYESVTLSVDNQIQDGVWSTEDSGYMSEVAHQMSPKQRSHLEHKIVQAINDGQLVVENIAMPLF